MFLRMATKEGREKLFVPRGIGYALKQNTVFFPLTQWVSQEYVHTFYSIKFIIL